MAKISLNAAPTFKASVDIPLPGDTVAAVVFTFKHRTKSDLESQNKRFAALVESGAELPSDLDTVMDCASAWELDEAFTRDNVALFLDQYHGAARAIAITYALELTQARRGN